MKRGPDHLRQRVDRFEPRDDSVSECANNLRELGIRVCSFENLAASPRQPLRLTGATVAQILDRVIERNPGYRWDEPRAGLINLFPAGSVLDAPVPDAAVCSKGVWRLLEDDLHIGTLGIIRYEQLGDSEGPTVDVNLEHANLRTVLNAVVDQLKSLVWHISGRPGAYYLSFTVVAE